MDKDTQTQTKSMYPIPYLIGLSLLIILLIGWIVYQRKEILELRAAVQRGNGTDLGGGVTKSDSTAVPSGDILSGPKDAGVPIDAVKTDMDANGSKPVAVIKNTASSDSQNQSGLPSSRTSRKPENPGKTEPALPLIPTPCPVLSGCLQDRYGYFTNSQFFNVEEKFGNIKIPVGELEFKAWEPNPWSQNIYSRNYELYTIIAEDSKKRKSSYSTLTIRTNGEAYKIPISESSIKYTEPDSSLEWNPRLMLGVSTGISVPIAYSWGPSLGMTVASYGQYESSPDWYFGEIAVGYEVQKQIPYFSLTPALYRISNHIPFTESLYLGPEIGIDINTNVLVMMGFKLGI